MKLSWLDTSEVHTNNTSIYMIWQYDAMLKVKERESLEKVDQSQTHGYVSRFEHTTLRPRLHTEGSFKPKNSFEKLALKILEKIRILALKNLLRNNSQMGYLKAQIKSARWQAERSKMTFRSTGRSPANGQKNDR